MNTSYLCMFSSKQELQVDLNTARLSDAMANIEQNNILCDSKIKVL